MESAEIRENCLERQRKERSLSWTSSFTCYMFVLLNWWSCIIASDTFDITKRFQGTIGESQYTELDPLTGYLFTNDGVTVFNTIRGVNVVTGVVSNNSISYQSTILRGILWYNNYFFTMGDSLSNSYTITNGFVVTKLGTSDFGPLAKKAMIHSSYTSYIIIGSNFSANRYDINLSNKVTVYTWPWVLIISDIKQINPSFIVVSGEFTGIYILDISQLNTVSTQSIPRSYSIETEPTIDELYSETGTNVNKYLSVSSGSNFILDLTSIVGSTINNLRKISKFMHLLVAKNNELIIIRTSDFTTRLTGGDLITISNNIKPGSFSNTFYLEIATNTVIISFSSNSQYYIGQITIPWDLDNCKTCVIDWRVQWEEWDTGYNLNKDSVPHIWVIAPIPLEYGSVLTASVPTISKWATAQCNSWTNNYLIWDIWITTYYLYQNTCLHPVINVQTWPAKYGIDSTTLPGTIKLWAVNAWANWINNYVIWVTCDANYYKYMNSCKNFPDPTWPFKYGVAANKIDLVPWSDPYCINWKGSFDKCVSCDAVQDYYLLPTTSTCLLKDDIDQKFGINRQNNQIFAWADSNWLNWTENYLIWVTWDLTSRFKILKQGKWLDWISEGLYMYLEINDWVTPSQIPNGYGINGNQVSPWYEATWQSCRYNYTEWVLYLQLNGQETSDINLLGNYSIAGEIGFKVEGAVNENTDQGLSSAILSQIDLSLIVEMVLPENSTAVLDSKILTKYDLSLLNTSAYKFGTVLNGTERAVSYIDLSIAKEVEFYYNNSKYGIRVFKSTFKNYVQYEEENETDDTTISPGGMQILKGAFAAGSSVVFFQSTGQALVMIKVLNTIDFYVFINADNPSNFYWFLNFISNTALDYIPNIFLQFSDKEGTPLYPKFEEFGKAIHIFENVGQFLTLISFFSVLKLLLKIFSLMVKLPWWLRKVDAWVNTELFFGLFEASHLDITWGIVLFVCNRKDVPLNTMNKIISVIFLAWLIIASVGIYIFIYFKVKILRKIEILEENFPQKLEQDLLFNENIFQKKIPLKTIENNWEMKIQHDYNNNSSIKREDLRLKNLKKLKNINKLNKNNNKTNKCENGLSEFKHIAAPENNLRSGSLSNINSPKSINKESEIIKNEKLKSSSVFQFLIENKVSHGNFFQYHLNLIFLIKDCILTALIYFLYYNPWIMMIWISVMQAILWGLMLKYDPFKVNWENMIAIVTFSSYLALDLWFLTILSVHFSENIKYNVFGFLMIIFACITLFFNVVVPNYFLLRDYIAEWKKRKMNAIQAQKINHLDQKSDNGAEWKNNRVVLSSSKGIKINISDNKKLDSNFIKLKGDNTKTKYSLMTKINNLKIRKHALGMNSLNASSCTEKDRSKKPQSKINNKIKNNNKTLKKFNRKNKLNNEVNTTNNKKENIQLNTNLNEVNESDLISSQSKRHNDSLEKHDETEEKNDASPTHCNPKLKMLVSNEGINHQETDSKKT